jgi:hypothetical protein
MWRRQILGERTRIITDNVPDGAKNSEAGLRGEIELSLTFEIPCKLAITTARYEWQVSYSLNGLPPKLKTVPRRRTIRCGKAFGIWVCR